MTKRPTLKDVAAVAEVSEMTASRALRGAADVSAGTRVRVADAAVALGYVPNRIAGALASRTVNLVGVVVPSLSSFVFPEVLAGVSAGLAGSGLQQVIGVSEYDFATEETVIREMLSWRPSGLIVAGLEHSDAARAMLASADAPVVEVMDVDGEAVDFCVGVSHLRAGRMMAETIVERGYRRIGFIGTKMPQDFRAQKRHRGFVERLAAAGLSLVDEMLYEGSSSIALGRRLTAELLARAPETECIYYSSDVMSIGGLMHCLANGLSVPGDLALAGFNGLDQLDGLPVRLATTDAYRFEIGLKAAELVRAGRKGGDVAEATFTLTPGIVPGESL